jgi:hypothetical protein
MRLLLIGALALSALAVQGCDRGGRTVVVHDQPVVEKDTTVVHDQPVIVHDDHHPGGPPPDRRFGPPPPPPDRRP